MHEGQDYTTGFSSASSGKRLSEGLTSGRLFSAPSIWPSHPQQLLHCLPSADDSDAIQRAIDDASREAASTKKGVAVYLPEGTYVVRKRILISSSYVVLRGVNVS